ncbi:MAG TPA: ABC transporter permease [Candidatus Atribacteria bacterium]|nr:ABC transporter permease [Candidatus Atribacteria bacterium]
MTIKDLSKKYEFYLFIIIISLCILFAFSTKEFLTIENFLDLLTNYSFLGIMSAGMLIVLISGGIDLSFTAIATISEYMIALIIINYNGNLLTAFIVSCCVGIILGSFNGYIIYYFKAPSLIVTIATLNIFYGFIILVTKGRWIYNFPIWFRETPNIFEFTSGNGTEYRIALPVLLLLFIFIITYILLNHTFLGRKIIAFGGNQEAARRMGFNILHITIFVYAFMGFLAGVGAISHVLIVQTVQANAIVGRELEVIAAVVLGGASLAGGKGTVLGTILGVTLIAIIWNGLVLMGISSYWHQVILGLIIIISVTSSAYSSRKSILGGTKIDIK